MDLSCEQGHVLIRVQDTGVVIPPENYAKVFGTTTKIGPGETGTAAGLISARKFAMDHGGGLTIERSVTAQMLREHPELGQIGLLSL